MFITSPLLYWDSSLFCSWLQKHWNRKHIEILYFWSTFLKMWSDAGLVEVNSSFIAFAAIKWVQSQFEELNHGSSMLGWLSDRDAFYERLSSWAPFSRCLSNSTYRICSRSCLWGNTYNKHQHYSVATSKRMCLYLKYYQVRNEELLLLFCRALFSMHP